MIKYPYFRFSKWLNKKEDLLEWFDWFVKNDIPCCIVKNSERFSLWRVGIEADDKNFGNIEKMEAEEIVMSYRWESVVA